MYDDIREQGEPRDLSKKLALHSKRTEGVEQNCSKS